MIRFYKSLRLKAYSEVVRMTNAEESGGSHVLETKTANDIDPGPLHMLNIAIALQNVGQRLSLIETRLEKNTGSPGKLSNKLIEILKVFFGGWPALALLFPDFSVS